MSERMLFGSAFSAVLPEEAKDCSTFRQIPDNQEVFTHPVRDQSIIVEIMEAADPQEPDETAIKTHFEDLATANGADESYIIHTETIRKEKLSMDQVHTCYYILGEQKIAKFNEADKNTVQIHIGLFRLPQYETDILVSFNDPINIGMNSSSFQPIPTSATRWLADDFKNVICSLKLLDPAIFG